MTNTGIVVQREGAIAQISWRNPPEGTFTRELVEGLHQHLNELEKQPVLVLVLSGQLEGVFIKHYEVRELVALTDMLRDQPELVEQMSGELHAFNKLITRLEAMDTITIAALNGTAQGGGFELALGCDFRLAADGPYKIGLLETQLGIIPGSGGTQRLTRLVGLGRALDIVCHGQVFTPGKALELGLVHRLYPADRFRAEVQAFARHLTTIAPAALIAAKHSVRESLALPLEAGLLYEQRKFFEVCNTREASDIMRGYVEGKGPEIKPIG
jgi:enoyl-CoA hydratase/carnithine racemase